MRREKTRLWWTDGCTYGYQVALRNPDGSFYLPEVKRTAFFGDDLFSDMASAIRAAEQNLERMAAERGVSPAEMLALLQARDAAWMGVRS